MTTASMITVTANGDATELAADTTVTQLIDHLDLPRQGIAVAVDGVMVPGSSWDRETLANGASVEIVTAVQGG